MTHDASAHEPDRPEWLTIGQVADAYHQSVRTIHRWIAKGCPVHKPAGRLLFDQTEVDAWVRSRWFQRAAGSETRSRRRKAA